MPRRRSNKDHLDDHFRNWPFDPSGISVRLVTGHDKREVIQMRIDMGILQLETTGRPDGTRPEGYETYHDYLISEAVRLGGEFELNDDLEHEIDREFVQYYHRRVCWLALCNFAKAVADADHTLGLMDFCRDHSRDEQWTITHEQYRPFVLFHRTQAAALAALESDGPETAIEEITNGLEKMREVFERYDALDQYDDDELVTRLQETRETLRQKHEIGKTLQEQLAEAIASEQYEVAARIRDELNRRNPRRR